MPATDACSRCGKRVQRGPGSAPLGKIVCRPCRQTAPAPYKPGSNTSSTVRRCVTCGKEIQRPDRKCDRCRIKGVYGTSNNVGHNERLYRTNREYLRQQCISQGIPCSHCRQPFDFTAPPRTRWAFTIDHIVPRSKGGSRDDLANMAPAHYSCNSRRGNRDLATVLVHEPNPPDPHSEEWP